MAMIITRTPVRISFFGGGTDYPAYYLRHGGATLATAVDKYVYVTVQHLTEYFDHKIQVHYSRVESVRTLDEIQIPNVREALRLLNITEGVEIHLVADLPARTGLGTSSATTVGLLKALHGHRGELISHFEVARKAIRVEQEMIGERVGSQDQNICAHGGFRHLQFALDGEIRVECLPFSQARLSDLSQRLMMMYTGVQRNAHEILLDQLHSTHDGQLDRQLGIMKDQVSRAIDILSGTGPIRQFGELLHEAWELKRTLSKNVSSPWLDQIYTRARGAGAIGGKLLGAGGGGFLLLFVEPGRREDLCRALPELREVRFGFEPQGSRVIYYSA
ncbi:MAG: kinase [Acidobacteria bacterium]|nr:kinase [Acidobacteriota bacterium]